MVGWWFLRVERCLVLGCMVVEGRLVCVLWMMWLVRELQWLMVCRGQIVYAMSVTSAIKGISIVVGGVISAGVALVLLLCRKGKGMCVD